MYRIDFGSLCTEYVHTVFLAKKYLFIFMFLQVTMLCWESLIKNVKKL
jgi:hypothetical protein